MTTLQFNGFRLLRLRTQPRPSQPRTCPYQSRKEDHALSEKNMSNGTGVPRNFKATSGIHRRGLGRRYANSKIQRLGFFSTLGANLLAGHQSDNPQCPSPLAKRNTLHKHKQPKRLSGFDRSCHSLYSTNKNQARQYFWRQQELPWPKIYSFMPEPSTSRFNTTLSGNSRPLDRLTWSTSPTKTK